MNTTTTTTKITTTISTAIPPSKDKESMLSKLGEYYNKNYKPNYHHPDGNKNYYNGAKNGDRKDCQPRNFTSFLLEVTSSFANGCVIESPSTHLANAIEDAKSNAEDILAPLQKLYQDIIENKESTIMEYEMIAQLEKHWNLLKQMQGSLPDVTSNENLNKIFNQLKFNADFLKEKLIYIKKAEEKFIEQKKVVKSKSLAVFEQENKISKIEKTYKEFCRNFIVAETRADLNTEHNRMHAYYQLHSENHSLHQHIHMHL